MDQSKFYTERRKNEIESILERSEVQGTLRQKLTLELKFLSCRDSYLRLKDKVVEGLLRERRLNRHYE